MTSSSSAAPAVPADDDRPAAVLWDMDGTIVDTEPYWMIAETEMIGSFGGTWTAEDGLQVVGMGLRDAAAIFQKQGVTWSVDEIIEWMTDRVLQQVAVDVPWRPGARELLAELREQGIRTALVTMSTTRMAKIVADAIGFTAFDAIVGGDQVERPKPHPDPYLLAAELLGVDIRDCVAIEDSVPGLTSAVASGAVAIGIPLHAPIPADDAHTLWPSLAGRTVEDLADLFRERRSRAAGAEDAEAHQPNAQSSETPQPDSPQPEAEHTAPDAVRRQSGPFRPGDKVQLTGPKGRLNTISLEPGKIFHTHRGGVEHDAVIGQPDGSVVTGTTGDEYLALRPLLNDFVMSMPRGAAIVYPKDAAQIVAFADIFPGATVVEAGVGSGALSLWLLRAIGPTGRLASFERREEFADVARGNITSFLGSAPRNWSVTVGDLVERLPHTVEAGSVDRVVLDMLAPWECIEVVADALTPGGLLVCYIATVTQLSRVAEAIRRSGLFTDPDSSETLVRGWHVEGLAVRPDHRMVAHTGFLLTARRLAPGAVLPQLKRRASKTDFSDEDVEAWTPGSLGERSATDKRLRKAARAAAGAAELAVAAEAYGENEHNERDKPNERDAADEGHEPDERDQADSESPSTAPGRSSDAT